MNVSSEIGTPAIDLILSQYNLSATLVTGKIKLLYDSLDDVNISSRGIYFNSYFEKSFTALGSNLDYNRFFTRFETFIPLTKKHNLRINGAYMLAWNKEQVPFYKWFYLGGPETFVGIDYFQASGTEFTVAATSYRYEVLESIYLRGIFNLCSIIVCWMVKNLRRY